MPRQYSFIIKHTTENECIRIYGIPEGKEQPNDISKINNMKFAYRNRELWWKGYCVDTVGKKYNSNKKLYRKSTKTGSGNGPDKFIPFKRPVYG